MDIDLRETIGRQSNKWRGENEYWWHTKWKGRDANSVAHSVAKFDMSLSNSFSCNNTNLSLSICEAW